ncbi:uncharacterized protein LOC143205105 [Rhynchophorus ferrugineus]|uniref:uncharacterized protein LOC143205105 n=1 Tax=Rhynchophorus ferrugineus TaxID=354439 RepID=UPI003FCED19D
MNMIKFVVLSCCLLVAVNAGKRGSEKISLEDIERDYSTSEKGVGRSLVQDSTSGVQSPTKFGFVPTRTAASYAAETSRPQYYQTNYAVKSSGSKAQYQQPSALLQGEYAQQYSNAYSTPSTSDYAQQYYDTQQYLTQQYALAQGAEKQVEYEQPTQQYEQYSNVQYVADNAVSQPEAQQQYSQSPQYYYVQQTPASSSLGTENSKGTADYANYLSAYSSGSIPSGQKYPTTYTTSYSTQGSSSLGSTKNSGLSSGYYSSKQSSRPKSVQYVQSAPSSGYSGGYNQEVLIRQQPKSLLESYVPSYVQLQYVRNQQGGKYSKY